jgi:hypothetical protein
MSLGSLSKAFPGWHYKPPAGMARPFLKIGSIDFNSVDPSPPIGEKQIICQANIGLGEFLVLHRMEVTASVLVSNQYEPMPKEAAHGMIYWNVESSSFAEQPQFSTGGPNQEVRNPGIGLFESFSVADGTMAPLIMRSSGTVNLCMTHIEAGGPGGILPLPIGSKLTGIMSGFVISDREFGEVVRHESAPTQAPIPSPRPRPQQRQSRPAQRPGRR